jgi:hypothetical protein
MSLATVIGIISVEDIAVLPKEDDAGIGMYRKECSEKYRFSFAIRQCS